MYDLHSLKTYSETNRLSDFPIVVISLATHLSDMNERLDKVEEAITYLIKLSGGANFD